MSQRLNPFFAQFALIATCFVAIFLMCRTVVASQVQPLPEAQQPAIVLVTFGTSVPSAQAAFAHIEQQVRRAFPTHEIRWAYTSKVIRKKLARSGTMIDSPEVALAKLMEAGVQRVVVQSLHMNPGAEFHEMCNNSKMFGQMTGGFERVIVSTPLLASDAAMDKTLRIVAGEIVPKERKPEEAVILMGHGSHHPSDAIYSAMMYKAQKLDARMFVATVEGSPSFAEVKEMLVHQGIKKAYLVPLMTVAGDHAINDMAGEGADSWKSQLRAVGIDAVPVLKGLAEFDSIGALWLENLREAMKRE